MTQMTKERFFVLKESKRNDDLYSEFNVVDEKTGEDLEAVCLSVMDLSSINGERFIKCNGFVGFLHSYTHKEYAQLFYTTRKKDEDKWSIDFNPAYTKDGELIFIKTYKECPFCIASRCRKENSKEYVTLSFIKHW